MKFLPVLPFLGRWLRVKRLLVCEGDFYSEFGSRKLSQKMNRANGWMSSIETGRYYPTDDDFLRFDELLGGFDLDQAYLITGRFPERLLSQVCAAMQDPGKAAALVKYLEGIPPDSSDEIPEPVAMNQDYYLIATETCPPRFFRWAGWTENIKLANTFWSDGLAHQCATDWLKRQPQDPGYGLVVAPISKFAMFPSKF